MKTAMILAAGRGERLRPLTWDRPKCLSLVNGEPLLGLHLRQLTLAGFQRIVINHAYLGGLIRQYVASLNYPDTDILFSPEPVGGLETGGGIRHALPLLGESPFVVVNADIVTDFDYTQLPMRLNKQAHLVLVAKPAHLRRADFGLRDDKHIRNDPKSWTYSGIACYHPDLIRSLPYGRYSIAPWFRQLADNELLTGQIHPGIWLDIGSLDRLAEAQTIELATGVYTLST